jgi:hypothetical protein
MGKHSKPEHAWARAKRERAAARTGAPSNHGRHATDGRAIAVGRVEQALGNADVNQVWAITDHDHTDERADSVDDRRMRAEDEALPRGPH